MMMTEAMTTKMTTAVSPWCIWQSTSEGGDGRRAKGKGYWRRWSTTARGQRGSSSEMECSARMSRLSTTAMAIDDSYQWRLSTMGWRQWQRRRWRRLREDGDVARTAKVWGQLSITAIDDCDQQQLSTTAINDGVRTGREFLFNWKDFSKKT